MNGAMYREIFSEKPPSISKGIEDEMWLVFQHDNDPKHTARGNEGVAS